MMSEPTMAKRFEDLLPEPLLMLTAEGQILNGNLAARRAFPAIAETCFLSDLGAKDTEKVKASLRLWSRSGDLIRGLVTLSGTEGERYIPYGARKCLEDVKGSYVLVRCQLDRTANQRFIEITQRVNALDREIARRQQIENDLFAEKELAQVTLKSIGDAVITTDTQGIINYLNPVAEILTGWSEGEARGLAVSEVFRIFNGQTQEPLESPVYQVLAGGKTVGPLNHTVLLRKDGTEFAINDSAAPIRDRDDQLIGVVMVFHDVTQARKLAAKMSYQASHDELTGLINRRSFEYRLRSLLESPEGTEDAHCLMFLDLDQFKVVNDTAGHLAGDALLRTLSPLLQKHMRHSDLLARLGGDEFGVLLHDCPPDVAKNIAIALKDTVEELNFVWEGRPFNIGVSIGQVNFTGKGWTLKDLLSAADNACYVAKENGRNRVHLYTSNDQELARRYRLTHWVGRIQEAFEKNLFCLYYQPIVPIASSSKETGQGGHFELLLRMHDEKGQLVSPLAFLPAAERYDLMVSIDQWVIETALHKLANAASTVIATCSINISGASLGHESFLGFVDKCFKQYSVPPEIICFEITETEAIQNIAMARNAIEELNALGCRLALDDFGSGVSSFGYLKSLKVDYLKIDGSFIKNIAKDRVDHAMVAAMNHVGHVMGLKTIAEYVETPQALEALRDIGVDYVQGFGISKPEPLDELLERQNPGMTAV